MSVAVVVPFMIWIAATLVADQVFGVREAVSLWIIWACSMSLSLIVFRKRRSNASIDGGFDERTSLLGDQTESRDQQSPQKCSLKVGVFVLSSLVQVGTLLVIGQPQSNPDGNSDLIAASTIASLVCLVLLFLAALSSHRIVSMLLLPVLAASTFVNLNAYLILADAFIGPFLISSIIFNSLAFLVAQEHISSSNGVVSYVDPSLSPYDQSSPLSYYTFWWVRPTLATANKKQSLAMEDLPSLAKLDEPALLQDRFSDWFDKYGHAATPFQFLVAIVFTIQPAVFLNSFLHGILFLMCMFVDPLLLNQLLKLDDSFVQSMWLVGALSLSMLIRVSCMEVCYYESTRVSNNVRTALALALFKYTVQSPPERVQNSAGLLTNLMATDTEKLGQFSWGVFALAQWVFAVLSLPFVIYFLHQLVGNGAFLGIAVLGFGIKAYLMIGEVLEAAQKRLQECRDERSKVMKQVLRAVKVTKLERLEEMWVVKLNEARNRELRQLRSVQYLSAFNNMAGALFSLCVPLSMFAWVTLVDGKELDTATAFSALAWIAQMQWSIISLPFIFNAWASLKPSLERIGTFLKSTTNLDSGNSRICSDSGHQFGEIHLKCKSNGLNASLNVEPGQLTVVIGATGSGKSRLLSSFVSPKEGDVSCVHGDVALVLQAPFLLNATVKENILFGLPFNEERLKDALQRTELVPDLEALPRGLMTMVGPSGVQLSGGQKARVCLARALYSDADCYLLDDILSAVDRTTGNRIWENVVAYLREKSKTVVLITHQIQFLTRPEVDKVVLMDRGEVRAEGKFQELAYNKHIAACLEFLSQDDVSSESRPASTTIQVEAVVSRKHDQPLLTLQEVRDFLKPLLTSLAGKPITEAVINEQILSHFQSAKFDDSEMVETSQKGAITLSDFAYYFKHFGSIFGAVGILVSVAFIAAFTNIFSTVWMAFWTDSSTDPSEKYSQGTYLAVYGALGFVQAGIACLQAILLTWAALGASTSIHKEMVQKLLSAPLSYFDTHSSGLILNRFLQDLGSVDSSVPTTMLDQVGKSFSILGQFILICFYTPFVMFILPVVLAFYSYIINTFRIAARDTRRIESVARSPVYDLFGDVLNGIETIQCFAAQSRFEDWNKRLVGTMSAAKVGNEAVNKWAQALTVQVSCLFYFFAGFAGVVLFYGGVISMSTLGLVLLNAAVLQRALMDFVMGLTQVETNFVAVERVAEFTKMRSESNELRNVNDDTDERLKTGRLEICGLRMRYAINRSYVLNGIQLAIEPGLKVAVIGRTGCGKSSLLAALAQLYPPSDGSIQIDSVDVRTMSQQSLQKTLRVIPQETVLFDGSVRENILVGREMNDATIWKTLETVQLKGKVSALGGLDAAVKFGGTEFSAGERQLLCLARALSSGIPKILLCDEVTSNVDLATDDLVLKALLGLDATVVMVMHRLESLRRFDKILMLQDGKVHVYGDANELIDNNVDVQRFMKQETH